MIRTTERFATLLHKTSIMSEQSNNRISTLRWVNLGAYFFNVAMTYTFGGSSAFDLPTNGEISQKYQTLVTPAGWAFSIWGIIFTLQLIWAVRPVLFHSGDRFLAAVGYNYLWIVLAQSTWSVCFTFERIGLSTVAMFVILTLLWRTVFVLRSEPSTLGEYAGWKLPLSLHAGWITAATTVAVSLQAVALEASSTFQLYVALLSVGVLVLVSAGLIYKHEYVMTLPIAWALLAVKAELGNPIESIATTFTGDEIQLAQTGAQMGSYAIVLAVVVAVVLRSFSGPQKPADTDASSESTVLAPKDESS